MKIKNKIYIEHEIKLLLEDSILGFVYPYIKLKTVFYFFLSKDLETMSRDRVVCKENTFVKPWIVKRIMRCETKIQRQNEECMSKTIETRVL